MTNSHLNKYYKNIHVQFSRNVPKAQVSINIQEKNAKTIS